MNVERQNCGIPILFVPAPSCETEMKAGRSTVCSLFAACSSGAEIRAGRVAVYPYCLLLRQALCGVSILFVAAPNAKKEMKAEPKEASGSCKMAAGCKVEEVCPAAQACEAEK